ncbi:bifunctional phosphopantothenoylcysteine decarboxylase/phosphopantothenate--cysteine ligase CoaBC [Vulgatibacter incomptus]|uniref:Coenzyme A biosynthesis bifunctional protein CoaBC n=1 Tax=Vulgatibacter incomptus TaxID=1391653 RepID=A0A0K1PDT1_9BACT|nr:bifunctional phosphopantothenoylcysteine decarboxylase/phosphopantothenate--cysteine ligase CoaBC [Vulgatibacter incomptus]AKU91662.1 Phosphopantothenoylcysteine decarboxylase [Vulgatibacter incomptus]
MRAAFRRFEVPMSREDRGPLAGRRIVWGFGGGIAAYKACHALRLAVHDGAKVHAAMTAAATRFVGPLTVQALTGAPVLTEVLEPSQEAQYGHLDLARGSDLLVLAPATADLIARVRAGMGNDAVSTTALAVRCPVLVAPAMNVAMWENSLVQENVEALRRTGRFHFVGPASGLLADGDVGPGRLAEPEEILEAIRRLLSPKDLQGLKIVVTAGPTREHLDPVRFLSNPSTGRMGYAVAEAARRRGAEVVLLTGPTELPPPEGVKLVRIVSAEELLHAALEHANDADVFVAAAAVADQRPAVRLDQKAKKQAGEESVVLERTPDVLKTFSERVEGRKQRPILVGFAAETEKVEEHARGKLAAKRLDLVVANDVGEAESGFGTTTNRVVLVAPDKVERLPLMPKTAVADAILDRVAALRAARGA